MQFFTEMEKDNGIYLDDDVDSSAPKEVIRTEVNNLDEGEVLNINNFLFNKLEFDDRKKRRFSSRKKEYREIKNMLKEIQRM